MDALLDEVESLEAILMEDVRIERNEDSIPQIIETTVFPLVGEDVDQQYVCVTLQVLPTNGYPDISPEFKLLRPRGLDDVRLGEIKAACEVKLQEAIGFPVVFDLIEVVREHLTGSNLPSGQCVVCLYGFCDGDEFTRTECFHYLHSYCLGRHLNAMRRNYQEEFNKLPTWQQKTADAFQALCPVCREPITDESESLRCAMPPSELENAPAFQPTKELRELQQRMSKLFLEQKNRGAIIDTDNENVSVISIESEQEFRRRLQRKQEEAASTVEANSGNNCNNNSMDSMPGAGNGYGCGNIVSETKSKTNQQRGNDIESSTSSQSSPCTTSTKQTIQTIEQPTSNHQHNRRHFRGGRRHHYHHHQHQTQRERERFEHHHIPASASSSSSSAVAAAAAAASNASSSTVLSTHTHTNGKQAKAHGAGHSHNR